MVAAQHRLPREDTLPWYRQFWPWFLILLPASVVVAAVSTLIIANRGADDLVVDEYYKDGLAINRQLEKQQRARELGIGADLLVEGRSIMVQTSGPVDASALRLRLSHPMEADRDFELMLDDFGSGVFRGTLTQPIAQRWHWILESPGDTAWRLDGTLGDADFGDAHR